MSWRFVVPLTLVALSLACAAEPPPAAEAERPPIDLVNYELIDLTHVYDGDTLYWPTAPSEFELEELAYGLTEAGFFYAANRFCTPEHGGTHLDAPIHFAADRWTTDQVPLERLVGPAVVIDVTEAAAADPDYRMSPEDLANWERRHGRVPAGSIVLLRTDWHLRWPEPSAYLGDDTPGDASNLHFPSFGEAAAIELVRDREIAALGVDTASIDFGPSTGFEVHRVANEANVPGLENLANLDALPPSGAWVIALPMKIGGGSGGPARVVALVPRAP